MCVTAIFSDERLLKSNRANPLRCRGKKRIRTQTN
jgi:hypothetical protein